MRLDFLPPDTLARIAWALADVHGPRAIDVAERTIHDLEESGEPIVADAWRSLRSVLEDVLAGRIGRDRVTVH